MYLAVEDRKSANPYAGHVMSAEWYPYFYEKESISAVLNKEEDAEEVAPNFEEGLLIKSTVGKATEITKDDAKTIQDEKDILMEFLKAATEKEFKEEKLDIEKVYSVMEKIGAAFEEGTLIDSIVKKPLKSHIMMTKISKKKGFNGSSHCSF